jgi:hypothetical protein
LRPDVVRMNHTTAKAVLAKASLYDQTMAKPDPGILDAWTEAIGAIDLNAALRAVAAHYTEEHRRIMPADVIKRVRAERVSFRTFELDNFNAVPDADPDDVPAYLDALRSGRLVDESPKTQRPMPQLVTEILRTKGEPA